MREYPVYSRPNQFTDIPAAPGFKARKKLKWEPHPAQWLDVIAWRVSSSADAKTVPIVCGPYGAYTLSLDHYEVSNGDTLEFLLPGQTEEVS